MAKKKQKVKKPGYKIYKVYKVSDGKLERNKICPKCGNSVFMAKHSDRWHCGRCGYTEFVSNKDTNTN